MESYKVQYIVQYILFVRYGIMHIHYLVNNLFTSSSLTIETINEMGRFLIPGMFATAGAGGERREFGYE